MSKFNFLHTLSESKSIFTVVQKAIVLSFVKYVAFLLGHSVDYRRSSGTDACGLTLT